MERTYLGPGESDGGWRHHQQRPLLPVISRDADGLYCLPQAHVIGQQQAAFPGNGKAARSEEESFTILQSLRAADKAQ